MSWVSINEDSCTVCGTCVERCACFSEKDGEIIASADENSCIGWVIVYPFVPPER